MQKDTGLRMATSVGLVVGAAGIGVLWAAGVEFPVAVPPGLVILLAGALVVALVRGRWVPAVGVVLGVFIVTGFLLSGQGVENLTGEHGTTRLLGQAVQLAGVIGAAIAGAFATYEAYRPVRRSG